jgi:hypothetical protein
MGSYRCYYLDERDMIFLAEIIEAASDEDAARRAAEMLANKPNTAAIEIWDLARLVDKLVRQNSTN